MPKYNDIELNSWRGTNAPFTLTLKEDITTALEQVIHPKYTPEARVLVIVSWSSGARPNETLNLKRTDVKKQGNNLLITFPGSKGSNARTLTFPLSSPLIMEAWKFIQKKWDWEYLFAHFRAERSKDHTTKTKMAVNPETGLKEKKSIRYDKTYSEVANNIGYWFKKKWGLRIPYYYRHNRMTIAAEDLPIRQLQEIKGAKKEESVYVYLRSTQQAREKIGKSLVK
jgi:integrase